MRGEISSMEANKRGMCTRNPIEAKSNHPPPIFVLFLSVSMLMGGANAALWVCGCGNVTEVLL